MDILFWFWHLVISLTVTLLVLAFVLGMVWICDLINDYLWKRKVKKWLDVPENKQWAIEQSDKYLEGENDEFKNHWN